MTNKQKIASLNKLLDMAKTLTVFTSVDPDFKNWKFLCVRSLKSIYGENSSEASQIENLKFFYNGIRIGGRDYSSENYRCFKRDFEQAIKLIQILKNEYEETANENNEESVSINKIFISHSSKDIKLVEEFVDLLETIGLDSNQIFCTSLSSYGIPLGENFIEKLKTELSASNTMVIFMLSENFYKSPVCMCEMGATWIQSKEHIPVLIPPFSFEEIDGTLKLTQGFMINDSMKWNEFKDKIVQTFELEDLSNSVWERKRDRAIGRINEFVTIGGNK